MSTRERSERAAGYNALTEIVNGLSCPTEYYQASVCGWSWIDALNEGYAPDEVASMALDGFEVSS